MEGLPSGIIGGLVAAFAVPVIIWAVNRSSPNKPDRKVAKYGPGTMGFLFIGTLFFGIPFVLMMVDMLPGEGTDEWWVRTIFGGFALLFLYSFADGLLRRLSWSANGISTRNWRGVRNTRWDEITVIDYRAGLQYWRIGLPGGAGFGFPETMAGAHAFLQAAFDHGVTITSGGKPIAQ